jgi:hypothetical protein
MENQISKRLGLLIGLNLNLNLFYSLTFTEYDTALQGNYSLKLKKHLIENGFEQYEYLYKNEKDRLEFKKENIRVVLIVGKKK